MHLDCGSGNTLSAGTEVLDSYGFAAGVAAAVGTGGRPSCACAMAGGSLLAGAVEMTSRVAIGTFVATGTIVTAGTIVAAGWAGATGVGVVAALAAKVTICLALSGKYVKAM